MSRLALVVLSLVSLSAAACGGSAGTVVRDDGVHHSMYPYRVAYTDTARFRFVSDDWAVENYRLDASGRPVDMKSGNAYVATMEVDVTGDGVPDKLGEFPRYDLRLEHRRTGALIYLRSLPLERNQADTDLEVLAHNIVEDLATSFLVTVAGPNAAAAAVKSAETGRITSQQRVQVSGHDALDFVLETFAGANPAPDAQPLRRTRYVFVRAPFRHPVKQVGRDTVYLPILVVLAYSAQPDQFDTAAADFDRFLGTFAVLDDGGVVRREASRLLRCDPDREATTLQIEVGADGAGKLVGTDVKPTKKSCQAVLINQLRFAATGQGRTFETTLTAQP